MATLAVDRSERQREWSRDYSRRVAAEGKEIGPIPKVVHPRVRAKARRNFRFFCEHYFPEAFPLAWSDDHLRVIAKIERAVLTGGLAAIGMPRGSGKTTLCERAVLWAVLYGHRRYVMLICADESKAEKRLRTLKIELESNDRLLEDFPEAVYPIRKLERIAQRAKGQTHKGAPTYINWGAAEVVLPTIPRSKASGAVVGVGGITSAVRGAIYTQPNGESIRPDLCLLDDPQTRESAASPSQCKTREEIVSADVLGMAGPGQSIAALMSLTVIRKDDMADKMLNRDLHPDWNGDRTKMIRAWPSRMDLWTQYDEIRRGCLLDGRDLSSATKFYGENRQAMDAGADVYWIARKLPEELSALENAMRLYFRDPDAFASEYQNEPIEQASNDQDLLPAEKIAEKQTGLERGAAPIGCQRVTAMIDVGKDVLWWLVAGWADEFTGAVLDYGAFPDQGMTYFTASQARTTLGDLSPGAGMEGAVYAGLETLVGQLCGRTWEREDGAELKVSRCLIDANWGESTDTVYTLCRNSPHATVLTPSHGKYVGASSKSMAEYQSKRGDRAGLNWRQPAVKGRLIRHVVFDANFWKSFVHARLFTSPGDAGCLSLFKARPSEHRMLADHLHAEYAVKTEGRGRTVHEWKHRAHRPDNHLFDCLVGAAVAASMEGAELAGTEARDKPARAARRYGALAEMQRVRRAAERR